MGLKEDILRLRAEGKTYNAIVEELGCSKGTVAHHCGEGVADKAFQRSRDRRSSWRKYIQEVKAKTPCTDCGENYPYYVMEFDHLPEFVKSFNISQSGQISSMADLKDEIAKCEVVCANCHKIRTWSRLVRTGSSIPETSMVDS